MGYVAQPFAVNLEKVRNVLGSNDMTLLYKIKSAQLYDTYASQATDCNFDQILIDLIVRYIKPEHRKANSKTQSGLKPKFAHEYGYALLVICDTIGTYLSPQGDVFYSGEFWKQANDLFKTEGIKIDLDRMWQTQKLFDIPDIPDFPVISCYTKSEIDYLLIEFKKINIDESRANSDSPNFDELQELLKVFRDGLRICKNKNVEWVSFMH